MIFRVTRKLARKIHVAPSQCLPRDSNPFLDWTARVFIAQRTQYIIIVNTSSLYSVVMNGRGITNDRKFAGCALDNMREFMLYDGHDFFRTFIAPGLGATSFSKACDRRVGGSINDLVTQAKFHVAVDALSPLETSFRVNEAPMSMLNYANPRDAFMELTLHRCTQDL